MSDHLYYPTEEELGRVREHIAMNSGFQEGGQPRAGRDEMDLLYPSGIKSFAEQVKINYRQMRRILLGQSGTRRSTWKRIMSQLEVSDPANEEELITELARMKGIEPKVLRGFITAVAS